MVQWVSGAKNNQACKQVGRAGFALALITTSELDFDSPIHLSFTLDPTALYHGHSINCIRSRANSSPSRLPTLTCNLGRLCFACPSNFSCSRTHRLILGTREPISFPRGEYPSTPIMPCQGNCNKQCDIIVASRYRTTGSVHLG